ncbi:MAG TPA: hypothetical protein PKA98_21640, partial [Acidimicrobiales bacterium]|nr:hypothetical protein [Acidimicrobiales bacterium]
VLLGAVRRTGDDTLVTIAPVTGLTSVEWAITPPSELTTTPDVDGIANIVDNDVDDIGWDPESDIVYGVLGGASLNYLGRLAWVLDDGSGGTTVSTTVPRDGGGAPDFGDVVRLDFVRIGSPAYNDVEGLGFSNVGATFGQFFGVVGDGGADDDEFLAFDKDTGAVTSLIDLRLDPSQGTGDQDYEGVDCVQPVLPGSLTLAELTTPADGTRFTFAGGAYGDIGSGSSADGLADGETETKTVNAGTYVVTQDPLSGWSLDDLSCTGDNGFGAGDFTVDLVARTVTVQVDAGQAVTCTYENSKDPVPSISVDKTVYRGHDDGAGCAGEEQVLGVNGDPVTWCFLVTNTGETTLSPVTLDDGPLGIDDTDMDVLVGDLSSLAPGGTATLYVQT